MDESEKKAVETGASELLSEGADTEALLRFMREKGFNETDSFLALSRIMKVDVGEAQLVVFRSKTWADRLESNIQLQESVMQAWRELSEENDDTDFKIRGRMGKTRLAQAVDFPQVHKVKRPLTSLWEQSTLIFTALPEKRRGAGRF